MKVTPLDLRQQRFRSAVRGFDRNEVVAFLAEVADDYEQALREADRLRQELTRSEALVTEHREHERNLRNTLLTAQKLADEIRHNAEQEGARLVREAEGRAEMVTQRAQSRLEDIQREIDGLKLKRRDAETALEGVIGGLRNALDYVREQEQREREEKILVLRPRQAPVAAPAAVPKEELPEAAER